MTVRSSSLSVSPIPDGPSAPRRTSERVARHAEILSTQLRSMREAMFAPQSRKTLRTFTSGEAGRLIGVADASLRHLTIDGVGPVPQFLPGGRRAYTLAQMNELRILFGKRPARDFADFVHRREAGDKLQVLAVANFKGGSAKTTTALHLAQYLALQGLRVLAIDLDPQASLTGMFGYQPEFDIGANETIYGALRYDEARRPMREVVRSTYFEGLDLVPGNIELMEFEHETPRAMLDRTLRGSNLFFRRIRAAIDEVADDYDTVVIDCPPQLGFLTVGALNAATGLLVTIHPQMVDVASMNQFLLMTADLLEVVEDAGGQLELDFIRYVVTRHDPNDMPETQIVTLLRSLFGEDVLQATVCKSTAIANAGLTKQTIYEVERQAVGRAAYDRAFGSMNAVNAEIFGLMEKVWDR